LCFTSTTPPAAPGLEKRFRRGEDAHHPGLLPCRQPGRIPVTSFLPIASYSAQAIGLAEYIANNHKGDGTPKVAMFLHPSAFGRGPLEDVQKAVAAGLKIEIVEVVEHGKDLDNTAMLQRLKSKGVQYVISQTIQSRLPPCSKMPAAWDSSPRSFGEAGKITFTGVSLHRRQRPGVPGRTGRGKFLLDDILHCNVRARCGTDAQLALAKKYGRDEKTANSHNYINGVMVAQVAAEVHPARQSQRPENHQRKPLRRMLAMNGINAFYPVTTVGPVTYSKTDKAGVDTLQLYAVKMVSSNPWANRLSLNTPVRFNN
jgi:branched-chain amino acid transport system substrate-binding protein